MKKWPAPVNPDSGADVDRPSRNATRVAPLHSAVASGSVALVKLLLEHGAHPDGAEFLEATPLHSAAGHGNREMVELLLVAGADRGRKTKDGKMAEDLARQYGHDELADWLANYSVVRGWLWLVQPIVVFHFLLVGSG